MNEELARRCEQALRRAGAREDGEALRAWVTKALAAHDAYLLEVCGCAPGEPGFDPEAYDPDDACEFIYAAMAAQDGFDDEDDAAVEGLLLRLNALMETVAEAIEEESLD